MNGSRIANDLWAAANLGRYRRFRRAMRRPEDVQWRILRGYLRFNAGTVFGRRWGFDRITSVRAFQERVPLSTYEDYRPYVDRIRCGQTDVLTRGAVTRLMPSSGSTDARKLIPHTPSLQAEFNRGIGPWVVDLFRRRPDLKNGPAYWSISPVVDMSGREESAVPIGFEDDTAYLGGAMRRLVGLVLAVPGHLRRVCDIEPFRFLTLLFLLRARALRLISVWHPTFLTLLLETLPVYWARLVEDIGAGTITPPGPVDDRVLAALRAAWNPDPRRAEELGRCGPAAPAAIWGRLGLISCWGDAGAAAALADLRRYFGEVAIQTKGLIATEAFCTVPFEGRWPVAVCSHFFEFLDDAGCPHLVEKLKSACEYSVVVTTGGGLYRYRLHDRVRVDGFVLDRTPSLRFMGRDDLVVDRFGEKISDGFVAQVLHRILDPLDLGVSFAMLAPDAPGAF